MKKTALPVLTGLWLLSPFAAGAQDASPPTASPSAVETSPAQAQSGQATIPPGALEVTATGTLEWLREDEMYVARRNAVARHDDTTLKADVMVAHYQVPAGKKSGSEITQVTADGNPVQLISPTAVAYGQHGVYDLPKHLVLLLGNNLKLVTTDEVVTAQDSLEYYEDLDTGVARGNAVVIRGDDKLTADVIAAKFVHHGGTRPGGRPGHPGVTPVNATVPAEADGNVDGAQKSHSLERLDAKGHVVLVTPTDIVTGDEGVYNPITDQATVIGNVHVTRDTNQLDGSRAEVDMATGISRVFAGPSAKVHGLFVPKKKDKTAGDTADAATDNTSDTAPDDAGVADANGGVR